MLREARPGRCFASRREPSRAQTLVPSPGNDAGEPMSSQEGEPVPRGPERRAFRAVRRAVRWGAIAAGISVALVAVLSVVVSLAADRWIRPLAEEEISAAIPGVVRMGGLGVSLLGLSVTIDDLAILPQGDDARPVIEVGRLQVGLAHLALLRRRIVLRQIEIDRPVVRVVREANGEFDLLRVLVPETPAAEPTAETPAPGGPIPVMLRRLELGEGRIEFVDRAKPGAKPLTIEISRTRFDDVVVVGDPDDGASRVHLAARSDEASVEVDGSFRRAADDLEVEATATASKLPLARTRVYLPDLGWRDLAGEVDATIHYVHQTGKVQNVDGSLELRGLRIGVEPLGDPALSIESLAVAVRALDLIGNRLDLGQVTLTKPRLVFDPEHPEQLPLLPKGIPRSSDDPAPPDAAPFAWSIEGAVIEGAELAPLGEGVVPLGLDARLEAMSSGSQQATAFTLELAQADGSVVIEGSACASPPGLRAAVSIDELALGPLVRVAAPGETDRVGGGMAHGKLTLGLGSLSAGETPVPAGDLRAAGTISLSGLDLKGDAGGTLGARLEKLDLSLESLEVPGLLGLPEGATPPEGAGRLLARGILGVSGVAVTSGAEGAFGFDLDALEIGFTKIEVPGLLAGAEEQRTAEPMQIVLDRARVVAPKLRLTRTAEGIVMPEVSPVKTAPLVKEEKPATVGAEVRVKLDSLALENGSVRFVDRTVTPFYQGDVTGLTVRARDLVFPEYRVGDARIDLAAPGAAPVWALGSYTRTTSWFELNIDRLPLPPLNPYVRSRSSYVVHRGDLSLYSKGSLIDGRLDASNSVTLYDPDVSGGGPDAPFDKALGLPASLAISLLKNPAGNVNLSIPIAYDEKGADVGLGSVVGSAVTGVLLGALSSPLKLLGAVVDATGRVKSVTPEPVRFQPGRAELAGDDDRVAALAQLAAARPALVLRLTGQTSVSDAQSIREATLLEALESGDGLPEPARGVGQALVRRRLRSALDARLSGQPEALDPEDTQRLGEWLEAVEVASDALPALARRRSALVQELLQTRFGLEAKQIKIAEPGPPGGASAPSVDVAIAS